MSWYKKKLHQKGTTSVVRGGPLHCENKKRFRDRVGDEGICGCGSWKTEAGRPVEATTRYGDEAQQWANTLFTKYHY